MLDILAIIPGKKKHTASGWYGFNAVCCHNRGHKPDKRSRGGVIFSDENNWSYHCFNCQFKCGFTLGKQLTKNTKLLLSWCGLDEDAINKISFESFKHRDLRELAQTKLKALVINFKQKELPDYAVKVSDKDIEHSIHIDYLASRGLSINDYNFYCIEDEERKRIIIPYYYENQCVGHTSRYYDGRKPKYVSDRPSGYVFNIDNQKPEWTSCILTEGEFDAISIDGCAYMGSTITDEQVQLLARLHRTMIVVPDRDESGLSICDRALQLGYKVSIPDWDSSVKDVNDAVKLYGKLPTLLSIFQYATSSKIKVEMARKKLEKNKK